MKETELLDGVIKIVFTVGKAAFWVCFGLLWFLFAFIGVEKNKD